MSNEPPRAIIEKLTEHYVKGIEMFANLEDQRFEFFKQRLDLLRIKPSVLRVLAADTDTQLAAQDKAKKVQAGHKRTQFLLNVAFGQEEESQKVDSIMRDLHEHTRQIEEKITMDLGRQAETLKARLSQRRKCKTKADSVCAFMDKSSPDRPSKIIRKYKHRIEGGVLLRTKSLTHERGGRQGLDLKRKASFELQARLQEEEVKTEHLVLHLQPAGEELAERPGEQG